MTEKTHIKEIVSVSNEGVSFTLTEKASLNGRGLKATKWYVSWDKIGKALFDEQYSDDERINTENRRLK